MCNANQVERGADQRPLDIPAACIHCYTSPGFLAYAGTSLTMPKMDVLLAICVCAGCVHCASNYFGAQRYSLEQWEGGGGGLWGVSQSGCVSCLYHRHRRGPPLRPYCPWA